MLKNKKNTKINANQMVRTKKKIVKLNYSVLNYPNYWSPLQHEKKIREIQLHEIFFVNIDFAKYYIFEHSGTRDEYERTII